jgi:threonine/homoserine/homoserine lactone efflux protein
VAVCHYAQGLTDHSRYAVRLERVGGALLIGAGARLAVTHQA